MHVTILVLQVLHATLAFTQKRTTSRTGLVSCIIINIVSKDEEESAQSTGNLEVGHFRPQVWFYPNLTYTLYYS